MICIEAFGAVFTEPVLEDCAQVKVVPLAKGAKTCGPVAQYAEAAFALLPQLEQPEKLGLVCVTGATGATVAAFDKAWQKSEDGRLTGPGFASSHYKRIHPFTLVKSLQNQVPAHLSMKFGIKGPCINALDEITALAYLLPNIQIMIEQQGAVVLVLAAAGYREEEQTKAKIQHPDDKGIEGAICFLLTQQGRLGYLEAAEPLDSDTKLAYAASPILAGGLKLLSSIHLAKSMCLLPLNETGGPRAAVQWRSF